MLGIPSFFGLGLEDRHVATSWLLLYFLLSERAWGLSLLVGGAVLELEGQVGSPGLALRASLLTCAAWNASLCIYIYTYVYTYEGMPLYLCGTHVYIYRNIHICIYVCIQVYMVTHKHFERTY